MRTCQKCLMLCSLINFSSPWIATHCLSYQFYSVAINKYRVFAGDKMFPFPCLATKKCNTTKNCPKHPFHYSCPVTTMSFMYSQHHRNRTCDQYECH